MADFPDILTLVVIFVAFIIGYSVVSFIVRRMKGSPPESSGRIPSGDTDQRAKEEARRWEKHRTQREGEFRRREQERQEEERQRREEERSRKEEESRWRQGASQHSDRRIKDEKYYSSILGLRDHVTPDDVRRRYRELVAQYHPDKVNHLGPKLREVAEREMKEINEAFEYFKRKFGIA